MQVTINKDWLQTVLREHIWLVTFTKLDGTQRVMRCTLKSEFVPESLTESTKKSNPDVVNVWDLDKGGWRSFRIENINEMTIEESESDSFE
mgnify:CR=1 FL=1